MFPIKVKKWLKLWSFYSFFRKSCEFSKWMVFCNQNCSDLLWEKIVLVIEKKTFEIRGWRPRVCKIYSNSERSEQFLVRECFFNLSLEVSQIQWIRTIRIQIVKNIGFWWYAGKVRKYTIIKIQIHKGYKLIVVD